jgi:hypothetical protein
MMKRLFITLSLIAVLGMLYPGLPTRAQPTHIPHENPETATSLLDGVGLLKSYNQIIDLVASSQYRDAQDTLNNLRYSDIPEDIRYITDQYSDLCQRLSATLENLEALLDEATDLLDNNRVYEAIERLDSTEADIRDAGYLLEDIRVATDSLSEKLGALGISAPDHLKQAYTRLDESMARLAGLIDEVSSLRQSLSERSDKMMELTPTDVSLSIKPASAFVGDNVTASGRLTGGGQPLSGKTLSLTVDDKPLAATTTGPDGSYTANLTLPYRYTDSINLTALFEPSGEDTGIYLASWSQPVNVNTMFYTTPLKFTAPEKAYPGLPFTVSGQVITNEDDIARTIKVLLGNTLLAEETVSGHFKFEVTTPEHILPGKYELTIVVTPQERYAGVSEKFTITISTLAVHVDTRVPSIILLPGDIRISGTAYYEFGPVKDAGVNIAVKDTSVTTRTSQNGAFSDIIRLGILPGGESYDLSPIGSQEIEIAVESPPAQGTAFRTKAHVFTVNPLSISLILTALAGAGLFTFRKSRASAPPQKVMPPAGVLEPPPAIPIPAPAPRLTGIKGQVLAAYRSGLAAVEKFTGRIMAPGITLREFLKIATLPSMVAAEQFAELTSIAESTLYSTRSPCKDTAVRAEKLADTIGEELHHGTP